MAMLSDLSYRTLESHSEELETYIRDCINNPKYMRHHVHEVKATIKEMLNRQRIIQRNNKDETPCSIGPP